MYFLTFEESVSIEETPCSIFAEVAFAGTLHVTLYVLAIVVLGFVASVGSVPIPTFTPK
jgi:hypothetical protein